MSQDDAVPGPAFEAWLDGVLSRAVAAGVPAATAKATLAGARHLPHVVERDRNQAEFTRSLRDYLAVAVSDARIEGGRRAARDHAGLLGRIEAAFGVDKEVVVAIWGLESSFGANRGDVPVVSALATLAFDGRRGAFFEQELLAALRILAAGDTTPQALRGSWAGAMGHTQFMPSSFEAQAVDFDGDGRRDIWSDDPTDALASTAAYLAQAGWTHGQPWAIEVVLPEGFDHGLARADNPQGPERWASLGVRDVEGRAVPSHGDAAILLPAGAKGPALMAFPNFGVLGRYNAADAYVIAVGQLADRIGGGGPLRAPWPEEPPLTFAERRELQERLVARGYDTGGLDGRIGPRTIQALRDWQRATGEVADGHPSRSLLERLR